MKIVVGNRQKKVKFDLPWLKRLARLALAECLKNPAHEKTVLPRLPGVEVTVISDADIADVHERFMQIAGPTDVITFDHGEILISAETACRNAARYGKSPVEELALYLIHGLLHLNGFADKHPADAAKMRSVQTRILKHCLTSLVQLNAK